MRKIIKLVLIIVWMGIIFSFSNDTGEVSTKKSDGIIIRTVETFLSRDLNSLEKEKWVKYLVVPVRKAAHFFVYLILGILIISFCQEFGDINNKMVLLALFLAFLYALSDEIHQMLVPGRSGQISDVLLDAIGSFVGIISYKLIYNRLRKEDLYE